MTQSMIKNATLHQMRYLIDCAKTEGWNPGVCDAVPFYFTDPNGFFIEWLDNQPIGCISAVAYNNSYGFMGFYIVEPNFRHQGYGINLWNHGIEYLGDRVIGLDGVVAQQNNYQKSGFELYHNNIRFGGNPKGISSPELQSLDKIPFQILLEYDAKIFGFNRSSFLQHWITMPNCYGLAKIDNGQLVGYGVIRKCEIGYKIGPLFADNTEVANQLYLGLIDPFKGETIYLDVMQTHSAAVEMAIESGLKQIFETARMYKKQPSRINNENIFGLTSFELG